MGDLAPAIGGLTLLYLAIQALPRLRWVAVAAVVLAVAEVLVWVLYVNALDSFGRIGWALLLAAVAATAAVGFAVRAVVLWRGWQGVVAFAAVAGGAAVLMLATLRFFYVI